MTIINPNSISGIASVTAQGNSLYFYESDSTTELTLNASVNGTTINATTGTFSGNVSIAGTITYEDVTNVDSVGIVTGRGDLHLVGTASSIGIRTDQPEVCLDASQATDAFALPQGTTAQRPTGDGKYMRWNSTNSALEIYNGQEWVEIITDYFPTGSVILG
tara:strand:+ start:1097 stop:1582 length:486 start_codon:yes stop_codon:yes gene_type:complete